MHNTHTDKRYQIENISNEYFQSDDAVVATVNDNNITNREVSLVKYSYHTKNALDKAIAKLGFIDLYPFCAPIDRKENYFDKE